MIDHNELGRRGMEKLLHRVGQLCFKDPNMNVKDLILSPGFLVTERRSFQNVHFDFEKIPMEEEKRPFVLHLPLCTEGMKLNIVKASGNEVFPITLHILFGTYVVTRADVLHGGCFGSAGNVRFHCIISKVPLHYNKLSYVYELNNVQLLED